MRKLLVLLLLAGCTSEANEPWTPPVTPGSTTTTVVQAKYVTCLDPFGFEYKTDPITAEHICRRIKE